MAFAESLKLKIRQDAHFACCLCHDLGVEIHHVIPAEAGGDDSEANAAPLCPTCHERYGANPDKRKFLREARDFWFEICAERYASDPGRLDQIHSALDEVATKDDVSGIITRMESLLSAAPNGAASEQLPTDLGQRLLAGESLRDYLRWLYRPVKSCGIRACDGLAEELREIGYTDVFSLHEVLGETREPFAQIAQERRDVGEEMDTGTDAYPLRLFLALWDETYCERHYPNIHRRNRTERHSFPWKRHKGTIAGETDGD